MAGYVHSVASISPGDTVTYKQGRHVATHKVWSVCRDRRTLLVEVGDDTYVFEVVRAEEIETVWKGR